MDKLIKLPNGEATRVGTNGFISVVVQMSLSEFIDNDLEGVLDIMSLRAIGCELLSDISYTIVGHDASCLDVQVTGYIGDLKELEFLAEIAEESLPQLEYEVTVTRVGYGERTIRLSARTVEEAHDIALDDAGNHSYREHASDYVAKAQRIS